MADNRKKSRQRVIKDGLITINQLSTLSCTIRNISEQGACLEVGNALLVPNDFTLEIRSNQTRRSCHVKWRTINRLGIAFV